MGSSPRRSWLYRSALSAVILLATASIVQFAWAQFARKSTASKGPRALGLIQLTANGKGRLVPVAIMVDGKFYDASSYKASPIPMALDFGIVYEGFRTGTSQGMFTITQPGQLNRTWIAEGTWLAAGAKPPEIHKKAEIPVIEDKDAPPRLHRGDKPVPNTADRKPAPPAAPVPASVPATAPASAPRVKDTPAPPAASVEEPIDDPNRPVLRRGKPIAAAHPERMKTFDEPLPALKSASAKDAGGNLIQWIPAISDAGGPDSRPYTFDLKPTEEASYRSKMLELANTELRARAKTQLPPAGQARASRNVPAAAKASFDDVKLRIFDLSNSNEPVLVLSARTHVAKTADANAVPEEITLVARTNLEGELHKLFFAQTDSRHLEIFPHMELIDAVDADGDGRGELLFRRTSDAGSSFAIYRATADQLWPLFEGTP